MSAQPNIRFRAAGLLQRENRILFQRNKKGDAWVLPGGQVEIGETSAEAIEREFQEELGLRIRVSRLICIIENFNAYEYDGLHEVGMYYMVTSDEEVPVNDSAFKGMDASVELTFKWISMDELDQHKLYPRALKGLLKNMPNEVKHYINNDKKASDDQEATTMIN